MKTAVIVFPGSNCDRDIAVALESVTGTAPQMVWHGESELPTGIGLVALPGGFSYGDYLRCGAISARSPIVRAVVEAAERGVPVLGICNGFQILTEAGLLPGALMRNQRLDFVCRDAHLTVGETRSPFTARYTAGEAVTIPVAHHDGNYFADDETLDRLEGEGRIAFRYADTVNGSVRDIAGLVSSSGTVLGLMPHPERRIDVAAHGGDDGRRLFEGVLQAVGA